MHKKTPLLKINGPKGNTIFLKDETKQVTGAFKYRGVYKKLSNIDFSKYAGIITASSGNHGQAVSLCAKQFKQKCYIVLPNNTSKCKKDAIVKNEAIIPEISLAHYGECQKWAKEFAKENNYLYVHSFDDEEIIEGHQSLFEELGDIDVDYFFCPIGGGGLISAALKSNIASKSKIIGVELENMDAMKKSLASNKQVEVKIKSDNIEFCEGLMADKIGDIAFSIAKENKLKVEIVDVEEIKKAIRILNNNGIVAEGAGAAGLAAALRQNKNCLCVISGGNIDPETLKKIIQEGE